MRRILIAAAALGSMLVGMPAAAQDLTYRHAWDGPSLLEQSNGRAYWLLLAECSGFYGAMSNVESDQAQSQAYLDEGVSLFALALGQARTDRSLTQAQAVDLLDPYVQRAREMGESSLTTNASVQTTGLTPRIVMTSTCGSLRRAYRTATGV